MGEPWDDPMRQSYWVSRMATAVDMYTLKVLLYKLRRTWEPTKERRIIEGMIMRRMEEFAQRS